MKGINSSMLKNNTIILITLLIRNYKAEHFFKKSNSLVSQIEMRCSLNMLMRGEYGYFEKNIFLIISICYKTQANFTFKIVFKIKK